MGVPIAFTMALVGFFGLYFLASPSVAINATTIQIYEVPLNFVLIAAPLFILMAQIVIFTGLGADLYGSMEKFLSGTPGSLALAGIGAGTVFAAATGSSTAACATIGPISLDEMTKRGYSRSLAAGSIAGAGGLAMMIPPSVLFILYGYVAQTSVAKLFLAGVVPGLMMAVAYGLFTILRVKRNPALAPGVPSLPWRERILALKKVWPLVALIILVLGSIYGGITTPTEAAAVGVLGSLILAGVYRKLTIQNIKDALIQTAHTTCFIFFIVVAATIFGFLMSYLRIPVRLTEAVTGAQMSPWVVLIIVNIIFIFLGMVMEAASLVLIVVPLILPTLLALGFNVTWLGVIVCLNIEMSMTTPPVGMNLYVLQGVGAPFGIRFGDVVKGALPYLGADLVVMILLMLIPSLALWLPGTMY